MTTSADPDNLRFGNFELAVAAGELRMNGRRVKLQPQPFKLLVLLSRRAGTLVSREEIRRELWPDGTFVDFDQAVNFSVKQVRDVLHDNAERPIYIETVPRRGYRFIAPIDTGLPQGPSDGDTAVRLQKALWENVAELRLAEVRRRRYTLYGASAVAALLLLALILFVIR